MFPPSRNKIIENLLRRFVTSNAVFFGLVHAPTLVSTVQKESRRRDAHPALYFAILAVVACDGPQGRAEPFTGDLDAAAESDRALSRRLANAAVGYISASLSTDSGLTVGLGQAASILALIDYEPHKVRSNSSQLELIHLVESIVRKLDLVSLVSTEEYDGQASGAVQSGSYDDIYYSRPTRRETPEAEIRYESIVRLCWTSTSHRMRLLVTHPDTSVGPAPEFLDKLRPMAFWEPSRLPAHLPEMFFRAQDVMRRSANLARLAFCISQLPSAIPSADETPSPGPVPSAGPSMPSTMVDSALRTEARKALDDLEDLEASYAPRAPRTEADRASMLGMTLSTFAEVHVASRLWLWKKFGVWRTDTDTDAEMGKSSLTMAAEPACALPSTLETWLLLFTDSMYSLEKDLRTAVQGGPDSEFNLSTTDAQIDSAICHLRVALQLAEATSGQAEIVKCIPRMLDVLEQHVGPPSLSSSKLRGEGGEGEAEGQATDPSAEQQSTGTQIPVPTPISGLTAPKRAAVLAERLDDARQSMYQTYARLASRGQGDAAFLAFIGPRK